MKKEKENEVFKYIIVNSKSLYAVFLTLEFLNKITFCEKEYHFFLDEIKSNANHSNSDMLENNDPLYDHEILNLLLIFLENQSPIFASLQSKLLKNSATNLISNIMRKHWLSSANPDKTIDKIISCLFKAVLFFEKKIFVNLFPE